MHPEPKVIAAMTLAVLLLGTAPAPAATRTTGTCEITFQASSTLHGFHGVSPTQQFTLTEHAGPPSADPSSPGTFWTTEIQVPVASLDTDNSSRDRNMRKMFEATQHPYIVAAFPHIDAEIATRYSGLEPDATEPLVFVLEIRGVAREVHATITHWKDEDAGLSFDADFPVSLAAYGLEPPSVLGIIRVRDKVDIHAHVKIDKPRL